MIEVNEVLLKRGNEWLHFSNPHDILSTINVNEVRDLLHEVERLANFNNWYAAGFLSYEAAPAFDRAFQVLQAPGFPLVWFGLYPQPRVVQTAEILGDLRTPVAPDWRASVGREGYNTAIEKIKDFIARGRTYQVNYTMRMRASSVGSEWNFFQSLVEGQNKYAAYLDISDYVICSASPELFFELDGESIISRPMKGTVPRGLTTLADRERADWLRNSPKNRAENVMIVDLIRNDIGRIAEIGSVSVPELFAIEKYPTLFQMTSTVHGKTKADLAEIFSALFPSGSITGAPKVSTMKIISELEDSPRRIYTGTIGYLAPQRKAQFNVAIRTVLIDKQTKSAEYGVGGGIVWDSTAMEEYDESLLKSRVLTAKPPEFSLFETMLWTADEGYFLLEKHLARMRDSAGYFDFPFPDGAIQSRLDAAAAAFGSPQRVRFLLDRSGALSVEAVSFHAQTTPYKVLLANGPVNSGNVFLYHKTTRREVYDNALAIPQIYNDVLLYNEGDELTEFTIGNLVVELNGEYVTPPISCGLLAGTFRAHLLETGQVRERVITKDALTQSPRIFMVNSLRKWVDVNLWLSGTS